MNALSLLAVGGGAALGAWARWGLGIALNPLFPTLPLGTLAANVVGGLLMAAQWASSPTTRARRRNCACSLPPAFSAASPLSPPFPPSPPPPAAARPVGWGAAHALLHGVRRAAGGPRGIGLMRLVLRA